MRTGILAAAMTLVLAGSAHAAGAPRWFAEPSFPNASDPFVPRVAESTSGDVLFSWVTADAPASHAVAIASLAAGPGDPVVTTSSRGGALADAGVYAPAIGLAPTGDALLAWKEGQHSLGLMLRQAPGDFGGALVEANPGTVHDQTESAPVAAGDANGRFTVAYGAELPSPYSNKAGNLDRILVWDVDAASGLITGPAEIGAMVTGPPDTAPITDLALAVAADGSAVLAYREYVAGSDYLEVVVRSGPDGAWSSPYVLDFSGDQPRVAINSGGTALVVWRHVPAFPSDDFEVRGAESQPGGSFQGVGPYPLVGTLSDPSLPSGEPNVALDRAGRGTVVWQSCTGCGAAGAYRNVLAQALTPGGQLDGTAQILSGQSPDPAFMNPQLAVTPSGAAIAVWKREAGGHSVLEYARRPKPGVPFGVAASIPADPEVATPAIDGGPELAVDTNGDAAVAWEQDNGSGIAVPHLARLDAAPPVAGAIHRSGGPPAPLVPMIFTLAPRDAVSPTTVRWRFGDGSTATGTTVRHLYGSGGTRTVTATVTDGAGYTSVAKLTLKLGGSPPPRFLGRPRAKPGLVHAGGRVHKVRISWRLSGAATVRLTLVRVVRGRVVFVLKRRLIAKRGAGETMLDVRMLATGRYRATLIASNGFGRSRPAQVTFVIAA